MCWHRHFALLLLAGTGSALLLAFPWLMPNLPVLGTGIALFFSQLCHQDPARSFVLAGTTLPVCARCLAFYLGGFAGIASYPLLGFRWRQGHRIKRLLVTDRRLGRNAKSAEEEDQNYAFFGEEPPGSGNARKARARRRRRTRSL